MKDSSLGIAPPGIVEQVEAYDRLTCLNAIRGLADRINADRAEMGVWLLRLKEACDRGQWLKDLKEEINHLSTINERPYQGKEPLA